MRFEIYQFKDGKFARILKFSPITWCEFTSGKAKLINFQKLVIQGFRRTAPVLFHKLILFFIFFSVKFKIIYSIDVHIKACTK